MFSKTLIAAVAASLFAATNAHLAIKAPAPIPGSNSKSPLDASGSNFPCQGADLSQGTSTSMAAGSTQPLQFDIGANGENWAVHGGGSCQISLTYETDKTKQKDPANWKVIHSFVGACPTNAKGNLDPAATACSGSDGTNCVFEGYSFTIPKEAKSGNAILAWTWFNTIGNREMYMNCAKVSITGGSGSLDSFPSMFVANIGNGCTTTEQTNLDFPNPGNSVTKASTQNYPLKAPTGSCPSGAGSANTPSSSTSGSGSSGSSSSGSAGSSSSSAPKSSASAAKSGGKGGNGGAFAEGDASASAAAPTATGKPAAASTPTPAAAPASAPASGSTGSCKNGGVPCSASGFYCIDGNNFGECAYGCAVPMKMAPGTVCANNAVAHAVAQKRHSGFFHRI